MLHCASSADRFTAAKALLDYGFANYALVQLETDGITPLPVKLGVCETVQPVPATDQPILIDKSLQAGVTQRVELETGLTAPIEAGQVLGQLIVESGEQELARIELVAEAAVPRQSLWQILGRLLRHLCLNGREAEN